MQTRKIVVEVIVILYASLLVYTAINKLMEFELNREQLSIMPLVSSFAGTFAWLLPLVEFIITVIIFLPKTRTLGLMMGTGLMLAFSGYVILLMTQPADLPCTCGGFLKALSWPQHLVFNLTFVLMGIIGWLWNRNINEAKQRMAHSVNFSRA